MKRSLLILFALVAGCTPADAPKSTSPPSKSATPATAPADDKKDGASMVEPNADATDVVLVSLSVPNMT